MCTDASPNTNRPPRAALPNLALVVSRYNATITDRLLAGAVRCYTQAGGRLQDLYVAQAAGSFEIVALAAAAARSGAFEGVLAIGCIIKGETRHDEFLGFAVTEGLARLSATPVPGPGGGERLVPVGLAVLTVNTVAQAEARAGGMHGGAGNKGEEAMLALLQTIGEVRGLEDPRAVRRAMATGAMVERVMSVAGPRGPDKARAEAAAPRGQEPRARSAR